MVAKVAGEQSIITNVARGKGHVISVDQALQKSLGAGSEKIKQWKQEMIRLAHHCSRVYSMYRYEWQIGYDIGVDRQGKVWYIEANPRVPAHGLFRKFEGEYDRIRKLALFHKRKQHET